MSESQPSQAGPEPGLPLEQFRPTRVTIGLAIVAALSAFLVHRDPWAGKQSAVQMVSVKSASRRLFPNLGEQDVAQASIELWLPGRARVRLLPDGAGHHQVFADDTLLGAADPGALDGLWASLRMANTLRAVSDRTELPPTAGGIEVVLGDEHLKLELAGPTGDGSGHYGKLVHEQGSQWVVEPELAMVLEQEPEGWLSKRLLAVEPPQVTRVELVHTSEGAPRLPLVLVRGEDSLWRARHERAAATPGQAPDGEPTPPAVGLVNEQLLATAAVETRLGRLLGAGLHPMVERGRIPEGSLFPWLRVDDVSGNTHTVKLGPECPGDPDARVVDRGPGLLGCISDDLIGPWPLTDPDSGLAESVLVPYAYVRILGVDMRRPSNQRLRRRGGGWVVEVGEPGEKPGEVMVSEPEVYRWYTEVSGIEVALGGAAFRPEIELVFETDVGRNLRVRCGPAAEPEVPAAGTGKPATGPGKPAAVRAKSSSKRPEKPRVGEGAAGRSGPEPMMCQRDDGPVLMVRSYDPRRMIFSDETFRDRRLTELAAGDVRWLEIEPGPGDSEVRQSVRRDLGIWQLDGPEHPDGSDALDEIRVEGMLAGFASVRAEKWVPRPPAKTRLRTLRVGRTPTRTRAPELSLHLHAGCIVDLPEMGRAARVSEADCKALSDDVLYIDPLREWLSSASAVELQELGHSEGVLRFTRREGIWYSEENQQVVAGALRDRLAGFDSWRAAGIAAGTPPTPARAKLRVIRPKKPVVVLTIGDNWVQVHKSRWYYVSAPGNGVGAAIEPPKQNPVP